MIATLENRVSIQFVAINDDVDSFRSVFNADNAKYIMIAVSCIIGLLIILGKAIEVIQYTLKDDRIRPSYIKNKFVEEAVWIILKQIRITIYP